MIRLLFLVAWGMHGIGHVAGITTPVWPKSGGFKIGEPWILPGDVLVTGPIGKLWALFWAVALVLTLTSVYGLATGAEWWRQAALFGAVASVLAIAPWARTVPSGALVGLAFDLGVMAMLLVPIPGLLKLVE